MSFSVVVRGSGGGQAVHAGGVLSRPTQEVWYQEWKGPLTLGGRQPHLPWCLLDELVLNQELTEKKYLFLRRTPNLILLLCLIDGRKDDRRVGRQMEGGSYSEVTASVRRTTNGSFQTQWLDATVESRARLQCWYFCVAMNLISENHKAGLKSEGISENMCLEFFGFAILVSAFIAYCTSHFHDLIRT